MRGVLARVGEETGSGCGGRWPREIYASVVTSCLGLLRQGKAWKGDMCTGASETVMRSLRGVRGGAAVAFVGLEKAQACVLLVGEEAERRFAARGRWWFLGMLNGEVREFVGAYGANDCVIEIQSVADLDFAVVDLLKQAPLDDAPDGMLIVAASGGDMETWRIGYLERLRGDDVDRYAAGGFANERWGDARLGRALDRLGADEELLRLGGNGFVVEDGDERRAVILQEEGFREVGVCTEEELRERSPRGVESMGLAGMTDRDIAIRALPGRWHEETRVDAAAYVFCW